MSMTSVYSYLPIVPGHDGFVSCEQALCIPLPRSYFRDGPSTFAEPLSMPDNRAECATRLMLLIVDCAKKIECEHVYIETICDSDLFFANTDKASVRQSAVEFYRVWILLGVGQVYQISKVLRTQLNCDEATEGQVKRRKIDTATSEEYEAMSKDQYITALRMFTAHRPAAQPLTFDVVDTPLEDGGEEQFSFDMLAAGDTAADSGSELPASSSTVSFEASHALAPFIVQYSTADARRTERVVAAQRNPMTYIVPNGVQFPQSVLNESLFAPVPVAKQLKRTVLPEFSMPTARLTRHIITTERLLGGTIIPPTNRADLEKKQLWL